MKAFESILTAFFRGLLYVLGFFIIGGLIGLVLKKGFLRGAYIALIGASLLSMIVSIVMMIGTPKSRKKHYFEANELDENDEPRVKGVLYPITISVVLLVAGFIVESFLH